MLLRSRAPFRISFAGGGTDLHPFCEKHGGRRGCGGSRSARGGC